MYGKAQGEEAAVSGIQLFNAHDATHIANFIIPTANNIATMNGKTADMTMERSLSIRTNRVE